MLFASSASAAGIMPSSAILTMIDFRRLDAASESLCGPNRFGFLIIAAMAADSARVSDARSLPK